MSDKVWAVLPAAGVGQRMSAALPKQYLELAGAPMIQHALEAIAGSGLCEALVVVLAPGDEAFENKVMPGLANAIRDQLQFAQGGADRAASVLAGVEHLAMSAGEQDWVLVHDVARPLVSGADVTRLYRQVVDQLDEGIAGGILAARLHDTIKRATADVKAGAEIARSEDRSLLWAAQTPQLFRLGQLREALRSAREAGVAVTDEAMAIERAGGRVALVPSGSNNLKVTTEQDLALAEMLLGNRSEAR